MDESVTKKLIILMGTLMLIALGPLLSIMAVNALFDAGIEYTFTNWFATAWLHVALGGGKI